MNRSIEVRPTQALRAVLLILLVALAGCSLWRSQQPEGDVSDRFQRWFRDLFPFLKTSSAGEQAQSQRLPIPAAKFSPGVAALTQGMSVDVVAFATDGTLPQRTFSAVEVAGLLDSRQTVLLALRAEQGQLLQEMLMRENVKLSYRLLPRPATTPTGQVAPSELATQTPTPAAGRRSLAIKVADLSAGLPLAALRDYTHQSDTFVELITVHETGTDPNKLKVTESYTDVSVVDLLDANGASIQDTVTVAQSVLLSVPEAHFDSLVKRLVDQKAVYLLAQPAPSESLATPTVTATATPVPVFSFDVVTSTIRSNLSGLVKDDELIVIVVVQEKDLEGKIIKYVSQHFVGVRVVAPPADTPGVLRVSLPLKVDDKEPAKDFAALVANESVKVHVLKLEKEQP